MLTGKVTRQIKLGDYAHAEAMLAKNTPDSKPFAARDLSVKALQKDAKL